MSNVIEGRPMREDQSKYSLGALYQNISNVKGFFQPYITGFKEQIGNIKLEGKAIYVINFLFLVYLCVIAILGKTIVVRLNITTLIMILGILFISFLMFKINPKEFNKPLSLFLDFSPIIFIWLCYDSLSIVQETLIYPRVHTTELYALDIKLFSWMFGGLTPNEWFATTFSSIAVDIIFGFSYLLHAIVPMIIGAILLFQHDRKNIRFIILSFSIVSLISFITYVVFPAAAPWYVTKYGFNPPDPATSYRESITAGLSRVDEFLGINLFHLYYGFESNSFASLPSVHAAYAMSAALCAYQKWKKKSLVIMIPYVFAIIFGAIYFYHHFIIDLIVGIGYSVMTHFIVTRIVKRANKVENGFS
ncbi:MAG: phosphatase PAP2 family protein [Candidatus Heimdallarchaeaceae archaeon]